MRSHLHPALAYGAGEGCRERLYRVGVMRGKSVVIPTLMAFMCMGLAGCGGDGGRVSRHVRDRHAYSLGKEHAERIIRLRDDEPALQDGLLDVRARITNINDRLGPQAPPIMSAVSWTISPSTTIHWPGCCSDAYPLSGV